ncbi:integrase arm-type DNA-binding domain-containing protein [Massilia sp. W12]|uniref:tyrosine-type recombinase/integrase n=1 Tax=Massilia sp. W12 TaxID=3126507 RepID=UPI0030D2724C
MPLTDTAIRNLKPSAKAQKYFDERGLFLLVSPSGGKLWRLRFQFDGKENLLALGKYPDVTLKDAREKRDQARKLLADGVNPCAQKKQEKRDRIRNAENSFAVLANEWLAKKKGTWSARYMRINQQAIETNVMPWLGKLPAASIQPLDVLDVLRRIEARGALKVAQRVMSMISQILRYGVATARVERDVTLDLRGALTQAKSQHFPAITEPAKVGALLCTLEAYGGSRYVRDALRLMPLFFVRSSELRTAKWVDFDFEKAQWRFLVTKTNTPHVVPLCRQAITILQELKQWSGRSEYLFPNELDQTKPMSHDGMRQAMRRCGIEKGEMTVHGFRAMARTIMEEVLDVRPDLIEHQLAHAVRDANGRAYNRTAHLGKRHVMMQQWADYLDMLKEQYRQTLQTAPQA